jgi:hypothetical protein
MPMRRWPRRRPASAPGSASTMMSVSTRASAIAHRDEFTRKAGGNARLRPHTHRHHSQQKELISTIRKVDSSYQPSRQRDRSRDRNRPGYTLKTGSGCRTIGVHLTYWLSPRDRRMNHVQLALGIITGACIGLFLTASSAGSGSAPLSGSSIPLSASTLSFLAGFGVEGVLKFNDHRFRRPV